MIFDDHGFVTIASRPHTPIVMKQTTGVVLAFPRGRSRRVNAAYVRQYQREVERVEKAQLRLFVGSVGVGSLVLAILQIIANG